MLNQNTDDSFFNQLLKNSLQIDQGMIFAVFPNKLSDSGIQQLMNYCKDLKNIEVCKKDFNGNRLNVKTIINYSKVLDTTDLMYVLGLSIYKKIMVGLFLYFFYLSWYLGYITTFISMFNGNEYLLGPSTWFSFIRNAFMAIGGIATFAGFFTIYRKIFPPQKVETTSTTKTPLAGLYNFFKGCFSIIWKILDQFLVGDEVRLIRIILNKIYKDISSVISNTAKRLVKLPSTIASGIYKNAFDWVKPLYAKVPFLKGGASRDNNPFTQLSDMFDLYIYQLSSISPPTISCTDIQNYSLLFEKYLADTPRDQLPFKTFEDGKTYYFGIFDSRIRWFTFLVEEEKEMSVISRKSRSRSRSQSRYSFSSKRQSSDFVKKEDQKDDCEYYVNKNLPATLPQGGVKGYYLLRLYSGKTVLRLMDLHFDLEAYIEIHKDELEVTSRIPEELSREMEKSTTRRTVRKTVTKH
jgi:hypothetical protein